nr:ankyrin repeat domain-containing protein [Pseudomonadota bacterium]
MFRVLAHNDLDTIPEALRILRTLVTHKATDVHRTCINGDTALITFIRNAKNYSPEFVKFILGLFVQKRTDLNQLTDNGKATALDVAVELKSKMLIDMLVSHGAYAFKEPGLAVQFALKERNDHLNLTVVNQHFNFKRGLSLISRSKPTKNYDVIID